MHLLRSGYSDLTKNKNMTILVTGGLGGIGLELVLKIAKDFPGTNFILVGKTQISEHLPTSINKKEFFVNARKIDSEATVKQLNYNWINHEKAVGVSNKLKQLRNQGILFEYLALDLMSENTVNEVFSEISNRYTSIDYIYHAAGVDRSKLFVDKNESDFKFVIESKVISTQNLFNSIHQFFIKKPITEIVLFSSITAEIGNIGQTDYSAANAFYKAYAIKLKAKFKNTTIRNILWPAWDEVGMAAKALKETLLNRGFKFISVEDGCRFILGTNKNPESFYEIITSSEPDLITGSTDFLKTNSKRSALVSLTPLEKTQLDFIGLPEIFSTVWKYHFVKNKAVLPGVCWVDGMNQLCREYLNSSEIFFIKVRFYRTLGVESTTPSTLRFQVIKSSTLTFLGQAARFSQLGKILNPIENYAIAEVRPLERNELKHILITDSENIVTSESFVKTPNCFELVKKFKWISGIELYKNLNKKFDGYLHPEFQKIKNFAIFDSSNIFLQVQRNSNDPDGFVLDTMNQGVVVFPEFLSLNMFGFLPHQLNGLSWFKSFENINNFIIHMKKKNFTEVYLELEVKFFDERTGELLVSIDTLVHQTTNIELLKGE